MILEQYMQYAREHKEFCIRLQEKRNRLEIDDTELEYLLKMECTTEYYKYLGRETVLKNGEKRFIKRGLLLEEEDAFLALNTDVHFGVEVGIETKINDLFQHVYHRHQFIELIYVYRGTYSHFIDGREEVFKQGEMCLINPNCIHYDPLGSGDQIVYIGIPLQLADTNRHILAQMSEKMRQFIERSMERESLQNEHICFYKKEQEFVELLPLFEIVAKEHYEKKIGNGYIILAIALRILEQAFAAYETEYISQASRKVERQFLHQIERYCKNYLKTVKKQHIQETFYFTGIQIDRIFKKMMNTTFSKYLIHLRMSKARELILEEGRSVEYSMEQIGYSNRTYFYKKFVELFGIHPGELKKQRKGYKGD